MRRLTQLVLACCWLLPLVAQAGSLAMLGLAPEGIAEDDAIRLTEALRRELVTAGHQILPAKDYLELKLVFGCSSDTDAACMAKAGRSIGADELLYGVLRGGAKRRVSLYLLDVKTATIQRTVIDLALSDDDLQPVGRDDLAVRLVRQLGLAGGLLAVTVDPVGASVTVDNVLRGPAPVTVAGLTAGPHTVGVSQDGYRSMSRIVVVEGSDTVNVTFKLTRYGRATKTRPAVAAGIALLVVGAAVAGAGLGTWEGGVVPQLRAAHDALERLAPTQYGQAHQGFLRNPTGCLLPDEPTAPSKDATAYRNACNSGQRLTNVTNGLWAGAGALGVAGVISLAVGLKHRPAAKAHAGWLPRLENVTPVFGPQGGGLSARFSF